MLKRFSKDNYVDVKNSEKEWCVGKVKEVKQEGYTITLDGYLFRHDIVNFFSYFALNCQTVEFDSARLAPFRQHTRGMNPENNFLNHSRLYWSE